ncbi:MAG: hypothetical protein ACI83P_000166 [Janthinobacterium sp.]|jgi:hypothetical protein
MTACQGSEYRIFSLALPICAGIVNSVFFIDRAICFDMLLMGCSKSICRMPCGVVPCCRNALRKFRYKMEYRTRLHCQLT